MWYRVNWHNDCQDEPVALSVNRMVMAGQVFLNGELIWQDDALEETSSRNWNLPRYWLLPRPLLAEQNTLLFHLWSPPHPGPGLGTVTLGPVDQVLPVYRTQLWEQRELFVINLSVSIVIAGLFLVFWLLRRSEYAFGWFALTSLFWSIGISNMLVTSAWPFDNGETWDRLSLVAFILYCCSFCMFAWAFGGMNFPRLARFIWGISAAVCVLVMVAPSVHIRALQLSASLGYRVLFILICLQFVIHACRTTAPAPGQRMLAACLLFFLVISTYGVLGQKASGLGYLGLLFSAPLMSVVMFLIVAWRFASSLRRIETFNEELQVAVTNTREELTHTLKREHHLEIDNIRLNERLRLTHDLHDSMGSALMRSIIHTEQSRSLSQDQFLSMLRSLRDDLRHVIDGTSATDITNGTPTEWIAPLRRRFVVLFDELGLTSHWVMPEQWPLPLPSSSRLALIRFVEEALSNAIKHSGASHLSVEMQATTQELSLCVSDNGRGFDVASVTFNDVGTGMRSMRARIERIGGQLEIESAPGATTLQVSLRNEPGIF